jgi:hypothetical protein
MMENMIKKMMEKRKHSRYVSHARVKFTDAFNVDALLKDISVIGCGIESTVFMDIKTGDRCKMEIVPEAASKIGKFEVTVEVQWIRTGGYSFEAGFTITESPKGKHFQRYVDYLSWR